jgi:ABC-2 type transport system permease protein
MSVTRVLAIGRANLVRLLRDRLGLFFILVLPIILILVTGLQFGGGFQPRAGVSGVSGDGFDADLADALAESWEITLHETDAEVRERVADGRLEVGVLLPPDYDERLLAGQAVRVGYLAPEGDDEAIGRQQVLDAAVAEQAAVVRAAAFTAGEAGGNPADHLDDAERLQADLAPLTVSVTTVGESFFPEELLGFTLGAQGQLVLFTFLTSLTGASQLILSRQLGVSRRMVSTPTTMPTILVGEAFGRFAVALFQAIFIVAATGLLFGVTWGDPLGATLVVVAFSLVAAGVAMLIGAVANNAEQASSIGVFAGLGVAAIGGAMVPPEIFPEPMATISWLTPHRWALDAFRELVAGGGVADVLPQLGVLFGMAVVLLGLATWRLRVALTR